MKERPILFSAPMVRAILDDSKTQTRRPVKFPRARDSFVLQDDGSGWWPYQSDDGESPLCNDGNEHPYSSPYGRPGDRLWVRENWKPQIVHSCGMDACDCDDVWVNYPAGGEGRHFRNEIPDEWTFPEKHKTGQCIPSIHMPRWASRITLEVTGVRVERLQEISDTDCVREGITAAECTAAGGWEKAYRRLWESLNGAGSWDANPWVWVVEFRRVEQ